MAVLVKKSSMPWNKRQPKVRTDLLVFEVAWSSVERGALLREHVGGRELSLSMSEFSQRSSGHLSRGMQRRVRLPAVSVGGLDEKVLVPQPVGTTVEPLSGSRPCCNAGHAE